MKNTNKKCEYCGVGINANCHGHKAGCPYSCIEKPVDNNNNIGSLPIENSSILYLPLLLFFLFKIIKNLFNKTNETTTN